MVNSIESIEHFAFETAIDKYADLTKQIKELKKEKDELRTKLLMEMKLANRERWEDDRYILSLNCYKRKLFDKEKALEILSASGTNTDEFFTETEQEVLKIKIKGDEVA